MLRLLYGYGAITDTAAKIDHSLPPSTPMVAAATAEYGKYVSVACVGCHGEHLSGGKILPGGPPDWPPATNLTPGAGSSMTRYPDAETFARMLQTGVRPDGSAILVMPFGSLRHMNATDVQALYAYLQTLPPRPAGER